MALVVEVQDIHLLQEQVVLVILLLLVHLKDMREHLVDHRKEQVAVAVLVDKVVQDLHRREVVLVVLDNL